MSSPISKVTASIRYDNARVVEWSLEEGYTYPDNFSVTVQNSRAGGEWEDISGNVKDSCVFVDTRRRNYGKWMNEFYRVRLKAGDEVYVSDPVMAGVQYAWPFSSEAENAVRQVEKQIKISGVTGTLLKRKYFGPRCPLCTDFAGQAPVNEHCPRCMGTGVDGGFFPGIPLSLTKDQIQRQENVSLGGNTMSETVSARCVAYPWIRTGDIWCEDGTNNRYKVVSCTPAATYKTVDLVYALGLSRYGYASEAHSAEADSLVVQKDVWTSPTPVDYARPSVEEKPPVKWTAVVKKDAGND